ncbi:MAG: hypothetical protein NW226_25845 [Microscillaceae bacterium]|nr:hypothetical protein [Microscillaceae bacterium]
MFGAGRKKKKKDFTKKEYDEWFNNLKKENTPSSTPQGVFEIKHTGGVNYEVYGGGTKFWVDGIRNDVILETKYVKNPDKSPFISETSIPDFIREKVIKEVEDEFSRMSRIINDPNNPLKSVEVIINELKAKDFFEKILKKYNIPGKVTIKD